MTILPQTKPHFPRTTASQRQYLFQVWESTLDVELACSKARVSKRTFYNWKKRFEVGGYEVLEEFENHAPKNPRRTPKEVELKVVQLRQKHPKWGKQRIADEIAKGNNWVPLVSPNTVRRILIDAGLWNQVKADINKKKPTKARTAEKPNQTVNIDLCFVPVSHEPEVKLPAVSGSSGKLLVQREPREAKEWPGRVFEDESLSYEEAMNKFIETSQTENQQNKIPLSPEELAALDTRAKKQAIGREEEALRVDRRKVREKRKAEDGAWKTIRELRAQEQVRLKDSQVLTPQPAQKSPHTCDGQKTSATAFANRQLADDKAGYTQSATKVAPSNQKEIPATPRGANETQPTSMTQLPQALSEPSGALLSKVLTQTSQTTQAAQKECPQSACDVSATSITAPANCQLAGHKAQLPEPTTGITSSNQKEILPPPSRANQAQPTNMTRQPQALSESSSGPPSRIVTQTSQTIQAAQNAQNPLTCDVSATFTTIKANSQLVNQKVEHTEPVTFTNSSNQKEIPEQTPPTNDTGPCDMTGQSLTTVVEEPSSAHRVVTQTSQTTLEEVDSSPFISDEEWRELRRRRSAVLREREQEDKEWREKRFSIRERLSALPLITAWLAILVIIDNCTRQCLALPLFMVGPNVTSQMVVDALQAVLPKELQYLISDRGTHFRAKVFAELAAIAGFEHVLTARHRPQSNGIAERFVRTLKEWLADKSWNSEEELLALLTQFREEYNDRPHQGLPQPGLSPNEYTRRMWMV